MADTCWNLISFYGNDKVVEQIKQWQSQLASFRPTEEDAYCIRAIRDVFYPDAKLTENFDYGSKWVHQDTDALSPEDHQLGFQSAWSSPDELQKHLTLILHRIDTNVLVENFFCIENKSEGYVYTAINGEGEICIKTAYAECAFDEFDDSEDAEEDMEERLTEYQIEALSDLIIEVPTTAAVIKKYLTNVDIDWTQFE
jgi:hypothetical protein